MAETRAGYEAGQPIPKEEVARLVKDLERQMKEARSMEFERAALLRDQIYELRATLSDTATPDTVLRVDGEGVARWRRRRRTPARRAAPRSLPLRGPAPALTAPPPSSPIEQTAGGKGTMNRTDRLLGILLELQARGVLRAEDLARRFEVSLRTVYRDVQALSETGVPVVAIPGQGYRLMEGYFLPAQLHRPRRPSCSSAASSCGSRWTRSCARSRRAP